MLYNRDLSWLDFNFRVLQEADDENVPLYERMKFISIFSSNLDEFFRVRYPSIFALSKLKPKMQEKAVTGFNTETIADMQEKISIQQKYFGAILVDKIIPALHKNGIHFYYNNDIRQEHVAEVKEFFLSKILTFIQPIILEGNFAQRFKPENNHLYFIVSLKNADQQTTRNAVINIPSNKLPRFFVLNSIDDEQYVIFIDDIIRQNLSFLFPATEITGVYSIKFNRDAELNLDDEYSEDLLNKIEKQLRKREVGPASRFLFDKEMPRNIQLFLSSVFDLQFEEMFAGGRYHNLSDLSSFPSFGKQLAYAKMPPLAVSSANQDLDIFNQLLHQDILLHFPYHSYNPVLSFFNQAAIDANVTEIFITLYRVAADSHVANALISAAKNGKKVTVFIELKARFDEANNIKWSREMKEAGIKMVYSEASIKVHSKIALITRVIDGKTVSSALISTGNFNEVTAQFYTDHLLMTSDAIIIEELVQLFKFLQKDDKEAKKAKLKFDKLLVSQFSMTERFEQLIEDEIRKVSLNLPACIKIKVNNMEEPGMINMLYKASQAGVKILLIVRGICCLVPGVEGLSENITLKRLVDRYLEHSRLFIFGLGDEAQVYMGSADWMTRNLYRRIEVCVPLTNPSIKKELIDYFDIQWSDTEKAVTITSTLDSIRNDAYNKKVNAQQAIYDYLKSKK